ncbi:SBBP repeat-containing protein [Lutimonas halocynthiae]|uniref:SBBP repeat-containing protein n=1 Tax=Lutimonas halocynthiae TaxID=1446477 RepID=UPI0025B555DD|nr:SBBP repeat-containing protein [Lutimonas halocynthiae]MDN3643151.1 SBBP repeat-containing protein [Lutimonas halocynthiae]
MKYLPITLLITILFTFNKLHSQATDSEIVFSTYLGNIGDDDADVVTVDAKGNTYLGCHSNSASLNLPEEKQYNLKNGIDAFVVKLNGNGTKMDYITQLGGSQWDAVQGLISDSEGNIYAVGTTYSADFPININEFQSKFGGMSDAFVLKLNTKGEIMWSTFIGGSKNEDGRGIALDQQGNVHIVGRTESNDFPILPGALQPKSAGKIDTFFATLNSEGKMMTTSYLGGSGNDIGFSIDIDNKGRRYIAGTTNSSDFPLYNSIQETKHGKDDIFFAVIDATGSTLEYSSYLGGDENEQLYGLALGPNENIFLTGITNSSDFPTTPNGYQPIHSGESDVFVSKFNIQEKRMTYSTFLGGEGDDSSRDLIIDDEGNAFIVGKTTSTNFPIVNNSHSMLRGRTDAFITLLDSSGSFLIYSTIFGGQGMETFEGVALGNDGSLTVSGLSSSLDYPTVNPIQDSFLGGRFDMVTTRLIIPKQE